MLVSLILGLLFFPGLTFSLWYFLPEWDDKRYYTNTVLEKLQEDIARQEEAINGGYGSVDDATPRGGGRGSTGNTPRGGGGAQRGSAVTFGGVEGQGGSRNQI